MRRSRNGTEWGMPRSDELGSVSFKPVGRDERVGMLYSTGISG
jgi:hypothetical protein